MKLATTTGDLAAYAATQPEAVELAMKAGFKNFDYNFGIDFDRKCGVFEKDCEGFYYDVKTKTEALGAKFVQAHSPMGRPIDSGNEEFCAMTARCVEACGILGIPNIVIHSGYNFGLTKAECFAKNKEFFLPLLKIAEKHGTNILVENFNKMEVPNLYWVDNAPELLELIELVDHPLFHAVWDTGHANMQEMSQSEALGIVGSHVLGIHVHDNDGLGDTHLLPYLGNLSFDDLMQGLIAINYKGYFTFEIGGIYSPANKRKRAENEKMLIPPVEARIAMEKYLFELGKSLLTAYGCFEE